MCVSESMCLSVCVCVLIETRRQKRVVLGAGFSGSGVNKLWSSVGTACTLNCGAVCPAPGDCNHLSDCV